MEKEMIQIRDLQFGYRRGRSLFSGIDLNLPKGSIVGLFGRNGEGKTTLLKLISGSLRARSGEINVMGYDICSRPLDFLQRVFVLPEIVTCPPVRIGTYLDIMAPFYPSYDANMADEILRTFDITRDMKLNKVSQGQQKKAVITFALAARTPLLLMDEPTNGLDIPSKSTFRRLLAGRNAEGQTVVVSTHQVRDLEALIDRVVMLDGNKIVCNESTTRLSSLFYFGLKEASLSPPIYVEPSPMGEYAVYRRETDAQPEMFSIELFFNGMIASPEAFRSAINSSQSV